MCWHTLSAPERFAAIAPIDAVPGPEFRSETHYLKKTAIWAFHSDAKVAVRFAYIKDMIERLKQGGSAKLTLYSGSESDPHARIYRDSAVRAWLSAQRQSRERPDIGEWIGHARGVFPPPRDVVRLLNILRRHVPSRRMPDREHKNDVLSDREQSPVVLPSAVKELPNFDGKEIVLRSNLAARGIRAQGVNRVKKSIVPRDGTCRGVLRIPEVRVLKLLLSAIIQNNLIDHASCAMLYLLRNSASISDRERPRPACRSSMPCRISAITAWRSASAETASRSNSSSVT